MRELWLSQDVARELLPNGTDKLPKNERLDGRTLSDTEVPGLLAPRPLHRWLAGTPSAFDSGQGELTRPHCLASPNCSQHKMSSEQHSLFGSLEGICSSH